MEDRLDLVGKLDEATRARRRFALDCTSPDDAKYSEATQNLVGLLSATAEWKACAFMQKILLETRVEFGQAEQRHVDEVEQALEKIDPLNMALIEEDRKLKINHDQLAVIEELGRYISPETKALLHPGTTSYDILDTVRAYLFRRAWSTTIRPEIAKPIEFLCGLSERSMEILQVGRTHLQRTSPILFGGMLAGYAARLAERVERCDSYFANLKGKASGIVGTGASIDMVIGQGKSLDFEKAFLAKLGLEPDLTATQIVQKEALADVGHGLTTLMHVLGDFANDVRILYSSEINEVTSRDNAERLGGSSADATKDNPVQYENMTGKAKIVESGMCILYGMISSDLQRDLRGSVMGRYQPQAMMVETYEAFRRLGKALPNLSINEDSIARNLQYVRNNPSEAMVAILRGEGWSHTKYGVGHDFVKEIGKKSKKTGRKLFEVAREDGEFNIVYDSLPQHKRDILLGGLEEYTGSSRERAQHNREYARRVLVT